MRRIEKKRKEKQNKKMAVMIAKKVLLGGGHRSGLRSRSSVNPLDAAAGSELEHEVSMPADISSQAIGTQNLNNERSMTHDH